MELIKKKIWPEYFNGIVSGKKKYEFRVADFEVNEDDVLLLEEWDPKTKKYTGRTIQKKVTQFIHFKPEDFNKFGDISKNGFYIMSLE